MLELNGGKPMLGGEQLDRLEHFFNIAYERHTIYIKKKEGFSRPWTKDTIYQNYYFCNVFRYLDKTSVWMIANIFNKHINEPDLWKHIFLSRYINKIETLKRLNKYETFKGKYDLLRSMQANKEKIFSSAFIVNSKGQGGTWQDKISYIFTLLKHFEGIDFDKIIMIQDMFSTILPASGVGNFMAYQYTMDFTYTRYLHNALDQDTFTCLGLGAVRGIKRILTGSPDSKKVKNELEIAIEILERWKKWIDWQNISDYNYCSFYELHLCDVEHWLCEYDKYCRGGSKKRNYPRV